MKTLADTIWDIVQKMFHNAPPLDLPVEIHRASSGSPLTSLDDENCRSRVHEILRRIGQECGR
ncbi:MAG: hypothetical protein ACRD30_02615 [Bryobacteraceae bacterium]